MFTGIHQNKISVHIIDQIKGAILSGRLRPGDQLPIERELINQFGVSKQTLREALRALEVMGFLEIRKGAGGGPVVMEVGVERARDSIAHFLHFRNVSVQDLSHVRKIIEPHLARTAAEEMTPDQIEKLASLNRQCRVLLDDGQNIAGAKEEIDFHILLGEASGNPVLMLILDFVNRLLADAKSRIRPGLEFCEQVLAAHERILEAIRRHDGRAAENAMYQHICEVQKNLETE